MKAWLYDEDSGSERSTETGMTNNEAAKWIQLYIDLAKIDPLTGEAAYLNNDDRKMIEAMEMAINELTAQPERQKGEWMTDDLSGLIYCGRCGNDAPMETTGGRQYKSKFCQTCGADMRGGQDDEQASTNVIKYMADDAPYFVDVEEALNMAINAMTAQPETHDKRTETNACDCISRQAAISLPVKPREDRYFQTENLDNAYEYGWRDLQGCIEKMPPAQPEIILCKDCKHRPIEKDGEIMPPKEDDWKCPCLCDDYFYSWRPKDNFFCASAERREE